jgi:UDPglucose 6-dehydrogenase
MENHVEHGTVKRDIIGIVGQGFVGSAVREGFRKHYDVLTYDSKAHHMLVSYNETEATEIENTNVDECYTELLQQTNVVFLCLPTPMNEDGSCSTGIVEGVIRRISECGVANGRPRIVIVIKSTVPPGFTKQMQERYPHFLFCHNPEFLTEANAVNDFIHQDRIVLGGVPEAIIPVDNLYRAAFPGVPIMLTDSTTSEMVKLFANVALACRVSLANELYQICVALNLNYDRVKSIATTDSRLGSHWNVPGPDKHMGFGGSCFIKDLNSLLHVASELGIPACNMLGAWNKNLEVRPERDWEQLKGRAVV